MKMAYTQYSQAWLEDPTSIFGILVEVTVYDVVAAAEKTLYLSNIGFITTDASVSYSPIIAGGINFTETLPVDGAPTMSFGDIELDNLNGELDSWLDSTKYIWVNRYIQAYIGDPFWQCANLSDVHSKFQKIFDGVIADIDSKARDKVNIKVRDKLNRLNVPITSNKIGTYGTWSAGQTNQDTIKPLIFGEVFNISPILISPAKASSLIATSISGTFTCSSTNLAVGQLVKITGTITDTTLYGDITVAVGGAFTLASASSTLLQVGQRVTISGSPYGVTITGYSNPTTYYIISTNGSTTFTLSATLGGSAITTTAGVLSAATVKALGATISGYTSPTNYYITATNSSTTFTLSTSLGGSAVVTTIGALSGVTVSSDATFGRPEYLLNDGNTESLIELRDNGAPIYNSTLTSGAVPDLTNGKVVLNKPLAGALTASVQGIKNSINLSTGDLVSGTYSNNIANLVALIVTQYGVDKLSASELDLTNLSAFATANTQPVGIIVSDSATVISVCQEIANSIGAQLFMTRTGKLQILRIGSPTSDSTVTIADTDILFQSLNINTRTEVVPTTKIGYCKNWTVQNNLVTAIFPEHKAYFAADYITKSALDSTIKATYKLSADAVQKDTLLLTSTDANAEAARLNNYYKVPRTIYSFVGTAKLLSLKLGQQVTLVNSRFGLTSGVTGQVVSLTPNWLEATINVEVIV